MAGFEVHKVSLEVSVGSQGCPRGVPEGSPGVPGGSLGSLRGLGRICSVTGVRFVGPSLFFCPASTCPKTSKIVNTNKTVVKTGSKPVFGIQNHDFWLRNPGSKGDPWGISVGSCGERSARDSERVVSSIYIYIYICIHILSHGFVHPF